MVIQVQNNTWLQLPDDYIVYDILKVNFTSTQEAFVCTNNIQHVIITSNFLHNSTHLWFSICVSYFFQIIWNQYNSTCYSDLIFYLVSFRKLELAQLNSTKLTFFCSAFNTFPSCINKGWMDLQSPESIFRVTGKQYIKMSTTGRNLICFYDQCAKDTKRHTFVSMSQMKPSSHCSAVLWDRYYIAQVMAD